MIILTLSIAVGCATLAAFIALVLMLWELKDNLAAREERKAKQCAELLAAQIEQEAEANTIAFLEHLRNKRNK